MKKAFLLIGILFSLITLDASAQINDGRWFGGAGVGFNFGFDGQKFIDRNFSHIGSGLAVDVYFGKFSPSVWDSGLGITDLAHPITIPSSAMTSSTMPTPISL